MREQPIFKDFDLPTQHLGGEHYHLPRPRTQAEADRWDRSPSGTVLAHAQRTGLEISSRVLGTVVDQPDVDFAARVLSMSGLNTAWYSFAQHAEAEVMRRRLKLPRLDGPLEWRPSARDLLREAQGGFEEATVAAFGVISAIEHRSPRKTAYKKTLGRAIGNASLTLAYVPMAGQIVMNQPISDADVQLLVRQRSLQTLGEARVLGHEIGSNPSIAQLADMDSDLSVYWRRNAPNGARSALIEASEVMRERARYARSSQ